MYLTRTTVRTKIHGTCTVMKHRLHEHNWHRNVCSFTAYDKAMQIKILIIRRTKENLPVKKECMNVVDIVMCVYLTLVVVNLPVSWGSYPGTISLIILQLKLGNVWFRGENPPNLAIDPECVSLVVASEAQNTLSSCSFQTRVNFYQLQSRPVSHEIKMRQTLTVSQSNYVCLLTRKLSFLHWRTVRT